MNRLLFGLVLFGLLLFTSVVSYGQFTGVRNMLSSYNLSRDTVSNSATGYLQIQYRGNIDGITIVATVTKVSGTVAGTLALQGSLDGTTFVPVNAIESSTALSHTLTDTTANYSFRIRGNPYQYYRVVQSGGTTMVSYLDAKAKSY